MSLCRFDFSWIPTRWQCGYLQDRDHSLTLIDIFMLVAYNFMNKLPEATMANLQIKNVQDDLYEEIKNLALSENRSVSQQVLALIKDYLAKRTRIASLKTPAEILLELSGAWQDPRDPDELIADIRGARKNSQKLQSGL